jgi:hypothetical protein
MARVCFANKRRGEGEDSISWDAFKSWYVGAVSPGFVSPPRASGRRSAAGPKARYATSSGSCTKRQQRREDQNQGGAKFATKTKLAGPVQVITLMNMTSPTRAT